MRLKNPEDAEILAHFTGDRADPGGIVGQGPHAVILSDQGLGLYGTTRGGGSGDSGTIFHIAEGGSVQTVHEFTETAKGRLPYQLQMHSDGWLWGGIGKRWGCRQGRSVSLPPGIEGV